jgi:hypothetical protein
LDQEVEPFLKESERFKESFNRNPARNITAEGWNSMKEKEVTVSSRGCSYLLNALQRHTGSQDQSEMVTVKVDVPCCDISSSRELLLVVRAPGGSKYQDQCFRSFDIWEKQSELSILNLQLLRIVAGIFMSDTQCNLRELNIISIKAYCLPVTWT